jgi:TctA family transporter
MKKLNWNNIKKLGKFIDLPFVYAGVIILVLSYICSFCNHNWVLFTGLALIVIGIIGYTVNNKRQSKY